MELTIDKPKIWKGYSYVLKTSWLQEALTAHQLTTHVHLVYWSPKITERVDWSLIDANYWLPNLHVNYHRFYIQVGVVPVLLKQQASSLMQSTVLPALVTWMVQQEKLDALSTDVNVRFRATLKNGALVIS